MAILKIYGDIADNETSACLNWCGIENVTLSEVSDFVRSMGEDDDTIDIIINSRGGSVSDGWGIYDALRQSGKKITATVEGMCASMASVILMAAPKELRFSAPHATFCIHEPRIPAYSIDEDMTADKLAQLSESLQAETRRFVDVYVERTGAPREEIERIMREDALMTAEEALSLGIIGAILTPNTASLTTKNDKMKRNVIARLIERVTALLEGAVAELRLTTSEGVELVINTDADDPKVGDEATPDGEHTLEDGRVVVVADGVITEIREVEETPTDEDVQALVDAVTNLTAEVERLQGLVKTDEEVAILDTVAKAGGKDWLDAVAVSDRSATQRVQKTSAQAQRVSLVRQKLDELKNK